MWGSVPFEDLGFMLQCPGVVVELTVEGLGLRRFGPSRSK